MSIDRHFGISLKCYTTKAVNAAAVYVRAPECSFLRRTGKRKDMKKTNIRKLTIAALLTAAAVAGSLFSFPFLGAKCSPVQHLVNIIGGVYLGPWYSLGMAFCASLLRNIFGLGSLMAFPGSMVGAFLSGVMYHWVFKGKGLSLRLSMAYLGELFGTSVIGGMLSFPVAYLLMNNTAATLFGFVLPFFASSVVGTVIAAVIVTSLKRVRAIDLFIEAQ